MSAAAAKEAVAIEALKHRSVSALCAASVATGRAPREPTDAEFAVCQRLVTDPSLHARWQPAFGAPHYKAHENGLRGHRSAFDELWAARGFARRFQCRFTAKRPREAEMHQMAAAPTVVVLKLHVMV